MSAQTLYGLFVAHIHTLAHTSIYIKHYIISQFGEISLDRTTIKTEIYKVKELKHYGSKVYVTY